MKVKVFIHKVTIYLSLCSSILMTYVSLVFLQSNLESINNLSLFAILIFLPIIFIFIASLREMIRTGKDGDGRPRERPKRMRIIFFSFTMFTIGLAILIILLAEINQPFILKGELIVPFYFGFSFLIIRMAIDAVRYLINILGSRHTIYFNIAIILLIVVIKSGGIF